MRILAFSDWRTQSKEMIEDIIREEKPDCIIYSGDDLDKILQLQAGLFLQSKNHFFQVDSSCFSEKSIFNFPLNSFDDFKESILKYVSPPFNGIETEDIPFYFVNGNDDSLIEKNGSFYLGKTNQIHIPFVLSDSGKKIRVIPTDYSTVSARIRYFYQLSQSPSFGLFEHNGFTIFGSKCGYGFTSDVFDLPNKYVDILIVHIPPLGILDLSTRFKTKHIGSEDVLNYIKKYQPKYVICGHSHMWGGQTEKIGESTVINISSHDNNGAIGNYVIINTDTGKFELKSRKIKTLRQVRGAYFKSEENFNIYGSIKGWYSQDLLKQNNEEIINNLEKNGRSVIADRIRSFSWTKPKIVKKLSFNPKNYALIDVETGIPKFVDLWQIKCKLWLIGIYYKGEILQFELPKQRVKFIKFIKENTINELVSWTTFDSKVLRNMKGLEHIKWMDACKRATYSIIWHSYKLHELYDVVFDHVDNEIIDGAIAGLYAEHLINKKNKCELCPSENSIKEKIKDRNKKDLIQMYELCELLYNYENE